MRALLRVFAFVAVFLLLLSACSDDSTSTAADSGDSGDSGDSFADEPAEDTAEVATGDDGPAASFAELAEEEPADEPAPADEEGSSQGLGVPTALTPADIGRDIIFRATITVESDDVSTASREAVAIIQGLGGIVFGQDTQTTPSPAP